MKDRLVDYLEENELLAKEHDENTPVDIIYLDFAKAFDSVPITRLIYKLRKYGISGDLLAWIEDFLTNRIQHEKK